MAPDLERGATDLVAFPGLSGPALGLFKIMSALKAVVVLGLGVALFFPLAPSGNSASTTTAEGIM